VKLLVLGGTKFLGRGIVDAALASGHEVTLFNRGQTNPELYAEVEKLHGDLAGDLDALSGREWDAAIDLDPTQLPRHTRRRAEALAGSVAHYVFVSTISVYSDPSKPIDESSPVFEPPDTEPDTFDPEQYGALKVGSERAGLRKAATCSRPARRRSWCSSSMRATSAPSSFTWPSCASGACSTPPALLSR
jgi:2'-hydroxyisoflavone reductase